MPGSLNGVSGVRLRFYERSTTLTAAGANGSQPKISIDNVAVTSTGGTGTAPTITGFSPSSIAANAGDTAAFTVTPAGDAANYYWYKETATTTNLISGATTATLTLANVLAANAANYQVVLSNATPPMATSSVVSLTVVDPFIATQPTSQARLVGGSISFTVGVLGTQPLNYRWYVKPTADSDFTGSQPLSNGGTVAGALTNILTITNLAYSDATNYFVVVTNGTSSVTSSVVALTVAATQVPLAFWNFNGSLIITNPLVTQGVGTAGFTNCTVFSNNIGSAIDYGGGSPNNGWGSSSYPTTNNKGAGVRFSTSTLGAKNITVSYDTRATSTASKYERLQFSTNGTDFIDYPTSSSFIQNVNYESRAFNLTGFPGVQNNTNFAIRIVTEYESTAKYGATNDAVYIGNGGNYAAGGTVTYDIVNIAGDAITNNNTPPTITSFTNMITLDTSVATVQNFSVGDAESVMGLANVSYSSQNQAVMSDGNISVTAVDGTGTNLALSVTPTLGSLGVAPILVTVTDTNGDPTTVWFYVTVNPGNQPPTISGLVKTNMLGNITNTFAFTIGDAETPAANLTLTAFSGNTTLVSNDLNHLSFGGSGASPTLIVTPVTNQYGVTPITVTVSDGTNNTSLSFVLEVRANLVTLLNDSFDYDNSGSIIGVSGGFWQTHSGTPGQMQVGSGQVMVTDANGEDVSAALIGQPYSPASNQVLYSSFTLNYSPGLLPANSGTYIAHFKDNSTDFYGRVYASTFNAAPGFYRLGIGNFSAVTNSTAQIAQDLSPGVNYTVVTRLVLSNGFSTIWINPTDETSPSMTDTTPVGSQSAITTYALRENGGEGTMTIDDLKVGLNFTSVITNLVDAPPQANPDAFSVMENGGTNTFAPLPNDVLNTPQGSLSLVSVSPTNGTATVSGANVLFKPATNFVGAATIGYTITDGFGGTSSSLITVTVTNNPPLASPDSYTVTENSVNNVLNPLTNDVVQTPGGSLTLVSVSPTNGTVAIINGTNVQFTPTMNFSGTATIGYAVTDNIGGTSTSLITVNVLNLTPIPVSAQLLGTNLVLTWTNAAFSLQTSTNVAGPYVTIPGANSPYTNLISTNAAGFFRLAH